LPEPYDIVICGGGLVGASLAIALGDLPIRIALVEAVLPQADESSFDERSIALSRSSKAILETLGVWPDFSGDAWPIDQIHVSEKGRFGTALLDAKEQGVNHLGHVIKSRILGPALWAALEQKPSIDVYCPARVTHIEQNETGVAVQLDDAGNTILQAGLLIVADGARSAVREQLGVGVANKSYEQSAIIGNVSVDRGNAGHVAYERFTSEGPLALLPGANGVYTFVLTRETDQVESTLALDDAAMLALLQETFGYRAGVFRKIGKRYAYPLYLTEADDLVAPNAIVIGNAAHGLHPVAGQGFNLGLRDAASLAELIAEQVSQQRFGTAHDALQADYKAWRETDQRNVVAFTDNLIRGFGSQKPMAGTARGLGMLAFDMLPAAKRELARHTMGLSGRTTRLSRGQRL